MDGPKSAAGGPIRASRGPRSSPIERNFSRVVGCRSGTNPARGAASRHARSLVMKLVKHALALVIAAPLFACAAPYNDCRWVDVFDDWGGVKVQFMHETTICTNLDPMEGCKGEWKHATIEEANWWFGRCGR